MIDPVSIGLMGVDLVTSGINYFRGKKDLERLEGELAAMGDSPNYTLSGDYDRMVNMALNAPQTGLSMAERAYADQAAAAGAYGSRGLSSLNAASRNLATTTADLEAQRLASIQSAIGTRAGAEQQVMNANVAQDISEYEAERSRLMAEQAAAQESVNAGVTGAINLGGGVVSGIASAAMGQGFGKGLEAFLNPTSGTYQQGPNSNSALGIPQGANFNPFTGVPLSQKNGGTTAKAGVKTLSPGDSFVTEGPEDHDKLEYLIAKMVKAKDGSVLRLEPVAKSTGGESHTVDKEGEMEVNSSQQLGSMKDGYDEYKRTGNWKKAIRAMRNVFEQIQFNK